MAIHGGAINANQLMLSLMQGENIPIPEINFDDPSFKLPSDVNSDLYKLVSRLTNADLTTGVVGGNGAFDALMTGFKVHLRDEFDANRISGAEYTKAFIALTGNAMAGAVQFLLGRDGAFWQAVTAQAQAISARVQLETAKVQYTAVLLEALNSRANYALTKLKLATEDVTFASGEFQLANILPQQKLMLLEQTEAARAQTLNNRTDGALVVGVLGKQKDLYNQQIVSYQRDAEMKAAKMFADAWTVQKTIDEGLLPPDGFTNSSLDAILTTIKTNNNLGA